MEQGRKTAREVIFLSFADANYSRSSTLLNFHSEDYIKSYQKLSPKFRFMIPDLIKLRNGINKDAIIVIGSPSHKATFFARLLLKNKVCLDAGWPLSDGIFSRGMDLVDIPKLLKSLILDFISFQFSEKLLVESQTQAKRIHNIFLVPKNKIVVSLTGLNERAFVGSAKDSKLISKLNSEIASLNMPLTVLFRGKLNNESGIEVIIEAAKELLTEATFIILSGGENRLESRPKNCIEVSNVTNLEMKEIYTLSNIVIGQVSNHPRLNYTIPHKAFEAAYFSKCFITTNSNGIAEILNPGSAVMITEGSRATLVSAIRSLRSSESRAKYEKNIAFMYSKNFCQRAINDNFEKNVLEKLR